MKEGVLPDWRIKELINEGVIEGADPELVNTSSIDLRLDSAQWKLIGSFLPLEGQNIPQILASRGIVDGRSQKDEFYVEHLQPYIINILESLSLPRTISAKIFNKSGRGRIGVSLKGLTNGTPQFDIVRNGYMGPLFAEISATSFPLVVHSGETSIPQVRFYEGNPQPLSGSELELLLRDHPILTDDVGNPSYTEEEKEEMVRTGKLTFTADIPREGLLAYGAVRDRRTIDLARKDYIPHEYFKEINFNENEGQVVKIHPGDFVLINSKQNVRLPPHIAAEIDEYSPELGDMKSHYAGLINASHGYDPDRSNTPSRIVFEVRARDLPVIIQDNQPLAKFNLYKMLGEPEGRYMDRRSTDFGDLKSILPSVFKKE